MKTIKEVYFLSNSNSIVVNHYKGLDNITYIACNGEDVGLFINENTTGIWKLKTK